MEAEPNNYFHGVNYDLAYLDRDVRDLLYHSQTNVTADPEEGFYFAVAAYDKGRIPAVHAIDPTASGEAAAKAGFRAEQLDMPVEAVAYWFDNSYRELRPYSQASRRELIATHLLEGRSWGLHLLRDHVAEVPTLVSKAYGAFMQAEHQVGEQHEHGERWDPYGTMVAHHFGAFEAYFGNYKAAAGLAMRGIWRAIRSGQELANARTDDLALTHGKFIAKQALANAAVFGLLLSAPLEHFSFGVRLRRKLAHKLLG